MSKIKIAIITPIYIVSNGGASIYFNSITRTLGNKYNFSIISESHKTEKNNYYGIFPKRGSLEYHNFLHKIFIFIYENLTYLKIFIVLSKIRPDVIHIHSSYFNNPNIFPIIFLILKIFYRSKFILDARDKMMKKYFYVFVKYFDNIICCSEDIHEIYKKILKKKNQNKIFQIPVLINEVKNFDKKSIPKEIINKKYIIYAGLIKSQKNVDLIIETFQQITSKQIQNLYLVLIGTVKNKKKYFYSKFNDKKIYYFEAMNNATVQNIIKESEIAINISPNEGVPQFCLESIANKKLVILPPNIIEFNEYAKENVFTGSTKEELNNFILKILNNKIYPNYPISRHFIRNQILKYEEIYEK